MNGHFKISMQLQEDGGWALPHCPDQKNTCVMGELAVARNTRVNFTPACGCADCNVHYRRICCLTSLLTGIALTNMWGTLGPLTASALELGIIWRSALKVRVRDAYCPLWLHFLYSEIVVGVWNCNSAQGSKARRVGRVGWTGVFVRNFDFHVFQSKKLQGGLWPSSF